MAKILDLPEREYRARSEISYSEWKIMRESPYHFLTRAERPVKVSDEMLLGTIVHARLLQPSTVDTDFIVGPDRGKRSNEDKAFWAEFELSASVSGKTVIPPWVWAESLKIESEVRSRSDFEPVRDLLAATDKREQCLVFDWLDVAVKGRFDGYSTKSKILWDLKTTAKGKEPDFTANAYRQGYHLQAALYTRGCREAGLEVDNFFFVVIETKPPYPVGLYRVPEETLTLGAAEMEGIIEVFKDCTKTGVWPSYGVSDLGSSKANRQEVISYGDY